MLFIIEAPFPQQSHKTIHHRERFINDWIIRRHTEVVCRFPILSIDKAEPVLFNYIFVVSRLCETILYQLRRNQ